MIKWIYLFVVLKYVSCAPSKDIYDDQAKNKWFTDGVDLTKINLDLIPNTKPAKNVILFLGDGMGISTTTAARIFDGQQRNKSGEENVLSWEKFPYTALSKTYNTNAQVADSAGTANAFACGVKTDWGVLGVNEKVQHGDCATAKGNEVLSILTFAEHSGMSTGLITDTRVTHATPAAFYSHSASRDWEGDQDLNDDACVDISRQLIEYPYGDGIEVVLGGGRRTFLKCGTYNPEGKLMNDSNCRMDGKDLTQEWLRKNNSAYVWNRTQLNAIDPKKTDHLLGLFADSGMAFVTDREKTNRTFEPTMDEMVEKALQILKRNPKGFFLLVEGGEIDWAHHDGYGQKALSQTVTFSKAVKKAIDLTNKEDTLIIVTADHSHSFVMHGYAKRGNPIFGFQSPNRARDGKPQLTLAYANGPGGLKPNRSREDLTGVNYNAADFRQQALVLTGRESHGGEDVGIYATGPFAHLFRGVVEQNYIFHVMDHALCLTESKQKFCTKPHDRGGPELGSGIDRPAVALSVILAALLANVVYY